ncbi:DUF4012 domain-containing protein [Candidatus Amesbacteria bacterium]|nr:DUF4012 domain-containing protein [Candidatus Amesbacteria bacterium]
MEPEIVHPIEPTVELPKKKNLVLKIITRISLGVVGIAVVLLVFAGIVYSMVQGSIRAITVRVNNLQKIGGAASEVTKSQNLKAFKELATKVQAEVTGIDLELKKLVWTKNIPVAGNYYKDGEAGIAAANAVIDAGIIAIDGITPYADVIGLKGLATTGDGAKTAADRISFIVETLDKLKPQLTQIGEKLAIAKSNIDKIDPTRYPLEYKGIQIRSQISTGINLLDQASALVNDAKPMLEAAPYLLGKDKPRKYLLLFQNEAELRPTGGFLTGYAVIEVNKGKITTVQSDDIYKLDEKFPKRIPAPDPIRKYHPNVPYWYLRDQNLSPDFRSSMDTFMKNYALTDSPKVDGVIAVTTKVLVDLLKVTGKIGVPGFGNFSAEDDPRCNCPSAFYELQLLAGSEEPVVWDSVSGKIVKAPVNYGNRKMFLGPVMYSVLANVMAQPKSKFPELFNAILSTISEKQAMMYFYDEKTQMAVEAFNMAGRVRKIPENEDYLMVVDTNFSGGKTNIWIRYEASQNIEVSPDGTVTKTLTLNYTNPQEGSVKIESGRRLNGLFRDWVRVYVPKGSELIESKGFETGEASGEDLGKTVFEGFFTLAPLNVKSITLKYKLPFKIKSPYKILVQKQGGAKDFIYKTKINGKNLPEFILNKDTENAFVY